jgi:hypothetical protein
MHAATPHAPRVLLVLACSGAGPWHDPHCTRWAPSRHALLGACLLVGACACSGGVCRAVWPRMRQHPLALPAPLPSLLSGRACRWGRVPETTLAMVQQASLRSPLRSLHETPQHSHASSSPLLSLVKVTVLRGWHASLTREAGTFNSVTFQWSHATSRRCTRHKTSPHPPPRCTRQARARVHCPRGLAHPCASTTSALHCPRGLELRHKPTAPRHRAPDGPRGAASVNEGTSLQAWGAVCGGPCSRPGCTACARTRLGAYGVSSHDASCGLRRVRPISLLLAHGLR